jgi:hypothetical protein
MARVTWLAGLVWATFAGCGGIQERCEGAEGCACFANDTCMAGLSCLSQLCVDDSRHEPGEHSELDSAAPQSQPDAGEPREVDTAPDDTQATDTPAPVFPIASKPARWFRADKGIQLADGGKISLWRDQSDQAADAIMGDAPRQPTFVAAGLNDRPEVSFGGAQSLYFPTFDSEQFTLLAVGRNANETGYHSIIIGPGGDTGNNQLRWDNGDTLMFVGLDINIPITEIPFGDTLVPHLVTVRYDGSLLEAYRNAELKGELATVSTGGWDVAQLGGWFSSEFMVGSLSEVVMYDRSLTDAELQLTQAALLEKYGL